MASHFVDITIKCKQCGDPFVLSAAEQEWFASNTRDDGQPFQQPKRCKGCRQKKNATVTSSVQAHTPSSPTSRPVVVETAPDRRGKRGGRGRHDRDVGFDRD